MNTPQSTPIADADRMLPLGKPPIPYERFGFSWGAVFAGLAVAIALNVFFAEIALSMNLGVVDRNTDPGKLAVGNAVFWVVTGIIALFAGAWITGRMATSRTRIEGAMHGLTVWGAGAALLLTVAVGLGGVLGGGVLALVGQGIEGVAEVGKIALPDAGAIKTELTAALDRSENALNADGERVASGNQRLAERARLTDFATRHFALDAGELGAGERREIVQAMSSQLGISAEDAEATLAQWEQSWRGAVARYESAKQEALQAAEQARELASAAAAWAAVAMVLSAAAALAGGALGTKHRIDRAFDEPLVLGHVQPPRNAVVGSDIGTVSAAPARP